MQTAEIEIVVKGKIVKITTQNIHNFNAKVDKSGPLPDQSNPHYTGLNRCWVWTGATTNRGYGSINLRRVMVGSHRFAFIVKNGSIPDGSQVLHRCDNPACVNPDHLFLGSRSDNMKDMCSKDRHNKPFGESHSSCKLTDKQVDEIRRIHQSRKITHRELGCMFGVSHNNIGQILRGQSRTRTS